MIKNEHQLMVTRAQLAKLKEALKLSLSKGFSMKPGLHQAMVEGLRSQIQDLEDEISEYGSLRTGKFHGSCSLEDLPVALIKARIAKNFTQEQLARVLDVKPQQIQKYEQTNYHGVSFARLVQIAKALSLEVEADYTASR